MKHRILITLPYFFAEEAAYVNRLLGEAEVTLHLRKPEATETELCALIEAIDEGYRKRLVLHGFEWIAKRYRLGGIHLSERQWRQQQTRPEMPAGCTVSASCHTLDDVANFPWQADYLFLSPIFNSLSKPGYRTAGFDETALCHILGTQPTPIVALGGVQKKDVARVCQWGMQGVAVIGAVWGNGPADGIEAISARMKSLFTPEIICLGGTDPSGGAGITADVQTARTMGARAYPIATAVTSQNEQEFFHTTWLSAQTIVQQIEALHPQACPAVAKVGLIENPDTLLEVCKALRKRYAHIRIVWDPILRSSSGRTFHQSTEAFEQLLPWLDVITPNRHEATMLWGEDLTTQRLQAEAKRFDMAIILKGGHAPGNMVIDQVITPEGCYESMVLRTGADKHGTGCAHSTALTAALARGRALPTAAAMAQQWVAELCHSDHMGLLPALTLRPQARYHTGRIGNTRRMFITHAAPGNPDIATQAEWACRMGADCVQLRMKTATDEEMLPMAFEVREICHRYGVLFLINDRTEIARQVNADGVHLGQGDMSIAEARQWLGLYKLIGRTCNTAEQAIAAHLEGADYLGVGPFRFTSTKKKLASILGLDGYKQLIDKLETEGIGIPIFAIGGITEADIPQLMQTGITGIALSGTMITEMKSRLQARP